MFDSTPRQYGLLFLGIYLLGFFAQTGICLEANDTEIVLHNSLVESSNLSSAFYKVDAANNSHGNTTAELHVDDFWDPPVIFEPSTEATTVHENEVSLVTFRVTVTSTPAPTTTTTTNAPVTTESSSIISVTPTKPSTTPTTTTTTTTTTSSTAAASVKPVASTTIPASTLATVRLHSNIVTVKPDTPLVVVGGSTSTTTTTRRPKKKKLQVVDKLQSRNDINSVSALDTSENANDGETEPDNEVWKMTLHGTNMNSEELRMCNKTLLAVHFMPNSRRKVARRLKKELDRAFGSFHYRFSVIISTTSRNTMGKALHGVWLSISVNGVHYFLTATYRLVEGPKLREDQLDKVEFWSHLHSITAQNMTGYRKYNRIATKLKMDLDQQYGHGNVWSVLIVKNRYLVKAKVFEDKVNHLEFARLNGGQYIIFRGGQNIDDSARNARFLSMSREIDEDETSEHSFREYSHEPPNRR